MANQRRGGLEGFKDKLQARRNTITYALLLAAGFLALAGWALLPEQVGLQYSGGQVTGLVDKNTAVLAHLAIGGGFGLLFWKWPRELAYLIASILGIVLAAGVLIANLGLV